MAGDTFAPGQYEFQCLHGMGEPLYDQVVGAISAGKLGRPCRIYAPVGTHETLLAYLVRRLLENGANTSLVNRIADTHIALAELVRNPVHVVEEAATASALPPGKPHPRIALPIDLFGARRKNSRGLLVREAGKSCANAVAEVRKAVDFLRYYAAQVRSDFNNESYLPLGPVACISPWNFPLAIFMGQISAALAAGNTVLAKPAEQTPLIAAQAVRLRHQAGVPRVAVQLLHGPGEAVGARLVADARVMGVLFTGSIEVARLLQRSLVGRCDAYGQPIPLVAETGGQNAMIVDSSALTEQVVSDVLISACDSAGQRCSALRVLCVQDDTADRVVRMLQGAMAELHMGNPDALDVDVGPVIDAQARSAIDRHIEQLRGSRRQSVPSSAP